MNSRTMARALPFVVVVFLVPLLTGVSAGISALMAFIVASQWWAGTWIWTRVRPLSSSWEQLGVGLALGTTLSTFTGLVVTAFVGTPWGWSAAPLIVVTIAVVRRTLWDKSAPSTGDSAGALALSAGILAGVGSILWAIRSYPLGDGNWSRYHPDMMFFEALGNSLASLGPLGSIFTPDSYVRYHWLVYAWSGQIQNSIGAEPFVVLTRLLPVVALIGAVLVTVAWIRSLTEQFGAALLAVALVVLGGFVGAAYGTVLNFDSPSLAFTIMSLSAALMIGGRLTLPGDIPRKSLIGELLVLAVLIAMVSGGKVSSAAVALAGLGLLWIISLFHRGFDRRRTTAVFVVGSLSSVITFVAVAAGSADPGGLRLGDLLDRSSSVQGLNPFPGSLGILLGTGALALAVLFRGIGVVWLFTSPRLRSEPWAWLGLGLLIASVAPILLISGGFNEVWFAVAAAGPLSVLSAYGVMKAWESAPAHHSRRAWGLAIAGAVVVSVLVVGLWSTGPSGGNVWTSTFRWAGPLVGLLGAILVGGIVATVRSRHVQGLVAWSAWSVIVLVLISLSGRVLTLVGPLGDQPGMRSDMFTPSVRFVETIDRATPDEEGSDLLAAAAWLRANSAQGDLVVTNITLWPTVTAVVNRPTLASNVWYQAPYGPAGRIPELLQREELSWQFISDPDDITAAGLCEFPVRWLVVNSEKTDASSWDPWATGVFSSGPISVLEWNSAACPVLP